MSKITTNLITKTAWVRTPIAVGTASVFATAALGTGVALAADVGSNSEATSTRTAAAGLADTTHTQADAQQKAAEHKEAAEQKANAWTVPVKGDYQLSADYGNSGGRWAQKHSGQDFAVPTGTEIGAVHKGTVVTAGWGGAYGNNVVIKHDNGRYTQYAHLSKLDVQPGERVNTNERIGLSGSTGNSSGPHLHFEVRTAPVYGTAIDPVDAMKEHGVKF